MQKSIKYGDILTVDSGIIVHGCNAMGVMGSGIALQIKRRYPAAYNSYRAHCIGISNAVDRLGTVDMVDVSDSLIVANAITQLGYGRESKCYVDYQAVREAFNRISDYALESGDIVHYPMIGAGLGGGDWAIISDIIDTALDGVKHTLWIYEP